MSKEAVFTLKLEADLRAEFMAETAEEHRPASQVMRELMRDYIEKRRKAREYDEYLHSKVNAGRASMKVGRGLSNDNVEEKFSVKRKAVR